MEFWLTIEIYHGEVSSADRCRDDRGKSLIEVAITNAAREWQWHDPRWGVILEILFDNEQTRDAFRDLPAVIAALDAVPDPVSGLLVYTGRGGGSGAAQPRRPRPTPAAGAAERQEPHHQYLDLTRR